MSRNFANVRTSRWYEIVMSRARPYYLVNNNISTLQTMFSIKSPLENGEVAELGKFDSNVTIIHFPNNFTVMAPG